MAESTFNLRGRGSQFDFEGIGGSAPGIRFGSNAEPAIKIKAICKERAIMGDEADVFFGGREVDEIVREGGELGGGEGLARQRGKQRVLVVAPVEKVSLSHLTTRFLLYRFL